jgi:hypothetical protein
VLLTVGTLGQRLIGFFAIGSLVDRNPRLRLVADLLPAAVVTALVVQLGMVTNGRFVIDARAAGLAVAALLVWRRAPLVVVAVAAAMTTATIRAFGVG